MGEVVSWEKVRGKQFIPPEDPPPTFPLTCWLLGSRLHPLSLVSSTAPGFASNSFHASGRSRSRGKRGFLEAWGRCGEVAGGVGVRCMGDACQQAHISLIFSSSLLSPPSLSPVGLNRREPPEPRLAPKAGLAKGGFAKGGFAKVSTPKPQRRGWQLRRPGPKKGPAKDGRGWQRRGWLLR